jgi:predicted component of type VI protein secretion system
MGTARLGVYQRPLATDVNDVRKLLTKSAGGGDQARREGARSAFEYGISSFVGHVNSSL